MVEEDVWYDRRLKKITLQVIHDVVIAVMGFCRTARHLSYHMIRSAAPRVKMKFLQASYIVQDVREGSLKPEIPV